MTNRKLKPFVKPLLGSVSLLLIAVIGIIGLNSREIENSDFTYVSKEIFDEILPVVSSQNDNSIIRPYTNDAVKIYSYYYNPDDEADKQENSIIYYENTYMQNSGVDYYSDNQFDVVAILAGTVLDVKEDETLGTTVEIKHTNNLISVYQGITDVKVTKDQSLNQGDVVGVSHQSKIYSNLKNSLHFEIYHEGKVVDPETFYDKKIKDL